MGRTYIPTPPTPDPPHQPSHSTHHCLSKKKHPTLDPDPLLSSPDSPLVSLPSHAAAHHPGDLPTGDPQPLPLLLPCIRRPHHPSQSQINPRQELESGPAVPDGDDADHLNTPRPKNRDGGRHHVLVIPAPAGNGLHLQVEGGGGGEELQQTAMFCSLPKDATAGADAAADATDATAVGSATLPAPAATVTVAAPSGGVVPCKSCNAAHAQAWWEKTFLFPRQDGNGNGNGTQLLLAFRFVFVAGKLQRPIRPEFGGVHSPYPCFR
nr:uncharacterized protein LOC109774607 [Aegilops tauschii subsp. strangulata]